MDTRQKYLVKDMIGLSVLRLNKQQLDDLLMRIRNIHDHIPETYRSVEDCLAVGGMKLLEVLD